MHKTLVFRGSAFASDGITHLCFLCIRTYDGPDRPDYERIASLTLEDAHSVLKGRGKVGKYPIDGSIAGLPQGQDVPVARLSVVLRDDMESLEQRPFRLNINFENGDVREIEAGYIRADHFNDLVSMEADVDIPDVVEMMSDFAVIKDKLRIKQMRQDAQDLLASADKLEASLQAANDSECEVSP